MIVPLQEATAEHGAAAERSAKIATVQGYVLTKDAMDESLDERQEQIKNLLDVRDTENKERVEAELKTIILTVHVPKTVETELEGAFDKLTKPALMRLSPAGKVANSLEPTIVIGLEDRKSVLDALRMLYAEMYTAENLEASDERHASIIIQSMPEVDSTYRVFRHDHYTIIEAQQGLGAWVGYGESDTFLFEHDELKHSTDGTHEGIFQKQGHFAEEKRTRVSNDLAHKVFTYAKELLDEKNQPVLVFVKDGECQCLGALSPLPE